MDSISVYAGRVGVPPTTPDSHHPSGGAFLSLAGAVPPLKLNAIALPNMEAE